jgi:hypothetical protein
MLWGIVWDEYALNELGLSYNAIGVILRNYVRGDNDVEMHLS